MLKMRKVGNRKDTKAAAQRNKQQRPIPLGRGRDSHVPLNRERVDGGNGAHSVLHGKRLATLVEGAGHAKAKQRQHIQGVRWDTSSPT